MKEPLPHPAEVVVGQVWAPKATKDERHLVVFRIHKGVAVMLGDGSGRSNIKVSSLLDPRGRYRFFRPDVKVWRAEQEANKAYWSERARARGKARREREAAAAAEVEGTP